MPDDDPRDPVGAQVLTERDWTTGVDLERGPNLRAAISNAMVGLKKNYFGKGATRARTTIFENYVFVVLEEVATRSEKTLVERGKEEVARDYRLRFQEVMGDVTMAAIEQLTERKVVAYQSQIVYDPDIGFEIFVLDSPPDSDRSR